MRLGDDDETMSKNKKYIIVICESSIWLIRRFEVAASWVFAIRSDHELTTRSKVDENKLWSHLLSRHSIRSNQSIDCWRIIVDLYLSGRSGLKHSPFYAVSLSLLSFKSYVRTRLFIVGELTWKLFHRGDLSNLTGLLSLDDSLRYGFSFLTGQSLASQFTVRLISGGISAIVDAKRPLQ